MCPGNGNCTSTPSTLVVGVELLDLGQEHRFRDLGREPKLKGAEPGGRAGATLGPHIDLAGRVAADEDCGKAGSHVDFVTQSRRNIGDTAAQPGGDRLAVDYFALSPTTLPSHCRPTLASRRFRIEQEAAYQPDPDLQ